MIWDKKYTRKDRVVTRKILDDTILVPIRGNLADMQRIFSLNPVAEHVWENLDGEKKMGEILDTILDRFDVDRQTASADFENFIDELAKENLIVEIS